MHSLVKRRRIGREWNQRPLPCQRISCNIFKRLRGVQDSAKCLIIRAFPLYNGLDCGLKNAPVFLARAYHSMLPTIDGGMGSYALVEPVGQCRIEEHLNQDILRNTLKLKKVCAL